MDESPSQQGCDARKPARADVMDHLNLSGISPAYGLAKSITPFNSVDCITFY